MEFSVYLCLVWNFPPLLFLLSNQCIIIMEELDHQLNNDSNHHHFGIVTADQLCRDSRMPEGSCQMVNNSERRAMSAARHCREAQSGESPNLDLDLEPSSQPCWRRRNHQTGWNNKDIHWPTQLEASGLA